MTVIDHPERVKVDDDCAEAARAYYRARYERRKNARNAKPAATEAARAA